MAFQSFIRDRGFDPVKVADETSKFLNRANNILEQSQAVSEIEYQQHAALISNLRSHRQREAQINTENHKLVMEGLEASERSRRNQADIDLSAARQTKQANQEKEQAQIEAIVKFAGTATNFAAQAQKEIQQKAQEEYTDKFNDVFGNADKYAEEFLALGVKLGTIGNAELADVSRAIALSKMEPRGVFEKLLYSDSALEGFGKKLAIEQAGTQLLSGGGLDSFILNNPNTTITFIKDGQPTSVPIGQIPQMEGVDYRAATTALFTSQMRPVVGQSDPAMAAGVSKKLFNYLNTKSYQRTREATRKAQIERLDQRRSLMFENDGISVHQYVSQSSLSPERSTWDSKQDVVKQLEFAPNPRQVFEDLGRMPDFANPTQTIGRIDSNTNQYKDPWYRQLHEKVIALERQKAESNSVNAQLNGRRAAKQAGEIAVRDGAFSEAEIRQARDNAMNMVEKGLMSGEEYRYFDNELSEYYNDFSDRKMTIKQFEEDKLNYQLDPGRIRDAVNKGVIPDSVAQEYIAAAAKQAQPDEVGAFGYGTEDVYKRFLAQTKAKLKYMDISGLPAFHDSAVDAAIAARADYVNEVQQLTSKGLPLSEAQKTAYRNVTAAIDKAQEGTKYQVTKENLAVGGDYVQRPFYNRFTPGNHPNSYTATEVNLNSSDIGRRISVQPDLLKSDSFKDLNGHLIDIARQIQKGQPVRLSKFAEDTWKASGLSFEEFWNPLLNRESSPYKGMKVTPGSYGETKNQIEQNNPELTSFFNNLTTERKNILLSKTNLISSDIGQGRAFYYGARDSVKRIGIPNENVVAAIAYLRTDGGAKTPQSLPQLYQSISEEFNVESYPTPEAFIAALPPPLQRDVNQVLTASNSLSTNHAPGMSRSNVRAASTQRRSSLRNELFRGATELGIDPVALGTIINFETKGYFLSGVDRNGLDVIGGANDEHLGWIQFSKDRAREYGVSKGMSPKQMMDAVIRYLKDQGVRPGDPLHVIYQAVQAPKYVAKSRETGLNYSADENGAVSAHVENMTSKHMPGITNFLKGN